MTDIIQIIIIAIAQGIGEFLPISSSGHNAVIEHLFERFGNPLTRDSTEFIKLNILLHIGSLIAIIVVFRKRIIDMFGKDLRLIPKLIVATIPVCVAGLLVYIFVPGSQEHLPTISVCFFISGLMLLYTLRVPEGKTTCSTMKWRDVLIIGCAQAIAILPGISRSGTTIVAALCCGLKREDAAAFSFLLAIPVIAATGLLACISISNHELNEPGALVPVLIYIMGAALSCVVGIIALVFLMDWIKKGKLWYFAIWLFVMSPLTLALYFW